MQADVMSDLNTGLDQASDLFRIGSATHEIAGYPDRLARKTEIFCCPIAPVGDGKTGSRLPLESLSQVTSQFGSIKKLWHYALSFFAVVLVYM
ncbi:hypothetical protein, partial [Staphylococcus pasteuri_A]